MSSIGRIVIYELDQEASTPVIKIFYSFVGQVEDGERVQRTHHYRQGKVDIDSIAM